MDFLRKIKVIIFLLLAFFCDAQTNKIQEKLFLLMASSEDLLTYWNLNMDDNPVESDTTKPAVIFTLENGRLSVFDTINYNFQINSYTEVCRHFEEFNFFFIREKENYRKSDIDHNGQYFHDDRQFISVLDYSSDTIILRKAIVDSIKNNCNVINGSAYLKDNEIQSSFSICDNQKPFNRNTINKYLKIEEIEESTFKNKNYERTESGFFIRTHPAWLFNKNGKLFKVFLKESGKEEETQFQFPNSTGNLNKYSHASYFLKTTASKREIIHKYLNRGIKDSVNVYYNFNIETNQLDSISTKYSIIGMNLYKDHIGYGTIGFYSPLYKNNKDLLPSSKRYTRKNGFIPNLEQITGKFYIWDFESNDFQIYSFKDLDLELLSIHEDWVYFREFDELKRIKISDLNTQKYTLKTELLVKDKDIVPHIHHVFWTSCSGIKKEWISQNK